MKMYYVRQVYCIDCRRLTNHLLTLRQFVADGLDGTRQCLACKHPAVAVLVPIVPDDCKVIIREENG